MRKSHLIGLSAALYLLGFPAVGLAEFQSFAIVNAGGNFSFDNGSNVSSHGDISFDGTALTFVGTSKYGRIPGSEIPISAFSLDEEEVRFYASSSSDPIPLKSLIQGSIFAITTNGNNIGVFEITASGSGSLSFNFINYDVDGPSVTSVLNNSSLIPNGLPNSGIAPSGLFTVQGVNLAVPDAVAILEDSAQGLPLSLNGTSVSVTVNGTTVHPAIYYSTPKQLAAVLPAATPIGSGLLTVTYNSVISNFPIQVVPTAYGFDVYNGAAVATDATTGGLITYTNSARPGQTLIFWGTGLGADPADSDTTYASNGGHQINTAVTLYIGGVQVPAANLMFSGQSVYPGVQIFGVMIPQGVPNGCYVPVVAVTGTSPNYAVSSTPILPIMNEGGVCSDSIYGLDGSFVSTLGSQNRIRYGWLQVGQLTRNGVTDNVANGAFDSYFFLNNYLTLTNLVSVGGCIVRSAGPLPVLIDGLTMSAGPITLQGPLGIFVLTLTNFDTYTLQLSAGAIPSELTFAGAGGQDVGQFTAPVSVPNPFLSWTNQIRCSNHQPRAGGRDRLDRRWHWNICFDYREFERSERRQRNLLLLRASELA